MSKENLKQVRRNRRKRGIRKRVMGTPERPRLTVTRTLKHTYAQIVNDLDGKTIVSAGSVQDRVAEGGNKQGATKIGTQIAERAKAAGITQVVFDRNGFLFHGRVKALADAAREAGLQF